MRKIDAPRAWGIERSDGALDPWAVDVKCVGANRAIRVVRETDYRKMAAVCREADKLDRAYELGVIGEPVFEWLRMALSALNAKEAKR